jgi:Trk K+ transport system NAD-binding subunit
VQRYVIARDSRAAGKAIADLPIGEETWLSLVLREGEATQARGSTVLEPGDEVLVLGEVADAHALRDLFEGVHGDGSPRHR